MKKKKQNKRLVLTTIIFLIGLAIASYPFISQWYYRLEAQDQVVQFEQAKSDLDSNVLAERIRLAHAYNQILDPSKLGDPYTNVQKEAVSEYARMLEVQEKLGHVEIPKINEDIPIYAGTSEEVLQKGAGHLEGTSLPVGGDSSHTVITAHRGLPSAKLFTALDKLDVGDVFYIHNIEGVLAYRVDQILTVEPSDFEHVLVVEGHDYATLLTCTPYMVNSHRLLVRGERIDYVPPVKEDLIQINKSAKLYQYLFYITLAVLLSLLGWLIWRRFKKK